MVAFVDSKTEAGQTPAVVAHKGFERQFRHLEQCLWRAAASSDNANSATGNLTADTSPAAGSSSDVKRLRNIRKRLRNILSSSSSSSSSSSRVTGTAAVAATGTGKGSSSSSSSTPSAGRQHEAEEGQEFWPAHWRYLDTYLMAKGLELMVPKESPLNKALDNASLGALDNAFLPQAAHKQAAQPCNMAYQASKSTAQLAVVLMHMVKQPWIYVTAVNSAGFAHREALRRCHARQTHAGWLWQPYALNHVRHEDGRHPMRKDTLSYHERRFSWLLHLPSVIMAAGVAAARASEEDGMRSPTGQILYGHDDELSGVLMFLDGGRYF